MTYDAYRESQRSELRSRLRLARAAVRVDPSPRATAIVRSDAEAHRLISSLYPRPYSRLEMEDWESEEQS